MKQYLQQKLQQRLSPQLVQYMRLLELPLIEMEERVKHELEENPALEEGKDLADADPEGVDGEEEFPKEQESIDENTDLSLGDYRTEDDIPDYKLQEFNSRPEQKEDIPFSVDESLGELLLEQLGLVSLDEEDMLIAKQLIGYIDDDGYMRSDFQRIADDLLFQEGKDVSEEQLLSVLSVIQSFDPPGVGARSLQECLTIQLKKRTPSTTTALAIELMEHHFEAYTRRNFSKIMEQMSIDEEEMKRVNKEIVSLNPKPGNVLSDSVDDALNRVVPDFIVDASNNELTLTLNNRNIPDMRISRSYKEMLEDYTSNKNNQTHDRRDALLFVKQKLDAAQGFIEAVRQRQDTLRLIMEAIIVLQKEFFLTGDESTLRPMILKDVAERAGYDISTVSRVSTKKYVQTYFGIYSLKYFFSEAAQTDSGEEVSTKEVKRLLKEFVDNEDKREPIADEELMSKLKSKGYQIARRTVAKYREQLGIPVARMRREI